MLRGYDIVTFGPSDWWTQNPSCCTHIMLRLARQNRVIYVNPISSDLSGMKSRRGLASRISRKLRSYFKLVRRADRNLWVLSPLYLPLQGYRFVDHVNNALVRIQVGALAKLLAMRRPILWLENVRAADHAMPGRWQRIVYHASDSFEECPYTRDRESLRRRERLATDRSDVVICVSRKLYHAKRQVHANVHYLPHGVDFHRFHAAPDGGPACKMLAGVPHPIAGYFGTLTANNDIELLEHCASALPRISFVFAGRVTGGDYRRLQSMPNVHFLGQVAYDKIPRLCASFDVCLLPWRIDRWIEHCSPLKLMEYLSCGRPVVSVPIPEVEAHFADVVRIARTRKEFAAAILEELRDDCPARRRLRNALARRHDWDAHVKKLSRIIENTPAASNTAQTSTRAAWQH